MNNLQSHILYIEDHADTRELVTFVLTQANHRVTPTSTSTDALKRARNEHFDLYLIDAWLPDGSGIELCKQLREFDPETPIMFLSAAAYDTDKQAAMENGAQRYLVKPVDVQVLSDEVNALVLAFANKHDQASGLTRNNSPARARAKAMRSSVFV
jgi:two-component system OmpR family response regulator